MFNIGKKFDWDNIEKVMDRLSPEHHLNRAGKKARRKVKKLNKVRI